MLNAQDKENVLKASQTANLLVQDLRCIVPSANLLLGELGMELLQQAVQLEQRLQRIASLTREDDQPS